MALINTWELTSFGLVRVLARTLLYFQNIPVTATSFRGQGFEKLANSPQSRHIFLSFGRLYCANKGAYGQR